VIRVAIVGLEAVTRRVHLPAYERLKHRCTVIAGCDADGRARKWAAEETSVAAVYESHF
jgi:predicted dehydrogenase